jgi:hypothetical protein
MVGGVTAAMVLLATAYCACASAAMAAHPMAGANHEMPCCASHHDPCGSSHSTHEPCRAECPHCQQAMTANHATAVDLSPAVHAWAIAWQPVLFASIQPEPAASDRWGLYECFSSISPRQLLRLHCALLI